MRETHTQHSENSNVWAEIVGRGVIGSIVFAGNLTGTSYFKLLQGGLSPNFDILFLDTEDVLSKRNLCY